MGDFGDVATPNEAYSFFKKRFCKLCGSSLRADRRTFRIGKEYSCTAYCISDEIHSHYICGIWWKDPKKIEQEFEEFRFSYNDKDYKLTIPYSDYYSINVGDGKLAFISVDGKEFEAKKELFNKVPITEKELSRKIETIRLLK